MVEICGKQWLKWFEQQMSCRFVALKSKWENLILASVTQWIHSRYIWTMRNNFHIAYYALKIARRVVTGSRGWGGGAPLQAGAAPGRRGGEVSLLPHRALDRLQPHSCGCESRRGDYMAGVCGGRARPRDKVNPPCVWSGGCWLYSLDKCRDWLLPPLCVVLPERLPWWNTKTTEQRWIDVPG